MGFKDLSAFNLAILGKQGWKFLTEPNSLVSRIIKHGTFHLSPILLLLSATIQVLCGVVSFVRVSLCEVERGGKPVPALQFLVLMLLGFPMVSV